MRIGAYGAIANASYSIAKALRSAGHDVEYITNPGDRYPMTQPFWEEVPLLLGPERFVDDVPRAAEWDQLAAAAGWERPAWIVDPAARCARLPAIALARGLHISGVAPAAVRRLRGQIQANSALIATMRRYDWLVVSGIGVVDAYLSGRPYTYWPNGGELRLLPFRDETPDDRFVAAGMRRAARGAAIAGTNDPTLAEVYERLGVNSPPFLPFLVDTERFAPGVDGDDLVAALRERAAGRPILFLAARQDCYWKGTHRFVEAFEQVVGEGERLFLVVSPWGADADELGATLRSGPARRSVAFLEGVPSKPILASLYGLADAVVDQFAIGAYGATMLEALACGTTVLVFLDLPGFRRYWPDYREPPVVNVRRPGEIADALRAIARRSLDTTSLGSEGRRWVLEEHGPAQTVRYLPPSYR